MNRLKYLREKNNNSMKEVARQLEIPYTTYVNYEKGTREPNSEMLVKLSDHFGVTVDYLIGKTSDPHTRKAAQRDNDKFSGRDSLPDNLIPITRLAPLLGTVRCGEPMYAEQNIEDYLPLPYKEDGYDYFYLHAVGDSMDVAGIADGDLLIVRVQPEVEPSDVAIVCINGDEATAKYCRFHGNMVVLTPRSSNPANQPMVFDMKKTPVHIIGRVVNVTKQL